MKADEFKSLDKETGVLGSVEDVREVVKALRVALRAVLLSPLALIMPRGMVLDLAAVTASAGSLIKQTSEADYMRELMRLTGFSPEETEFEVRREGLSEVYPITHPNHTRLNLPPLDPNDPEVRDSFILSSLMEEEKKAAEAPTERTLLSPELESFLQELSRGDKEEEV